MEYTVDDVAQRIENDCLCYAIQCNLNVDKVEDQHLANLIAEAAILLDEIELYIEDNKTREEEN